MSLVNMKELITQAEIKGTGVGAFNVGNMEMVMGVVKAAEETNTPVIMQIAEGRLPHSPLALIGPMMVAAANNAKVDIGVPLVLHGGSGISDEDFQEAIRCGIRKVNIATASLRAAAGSARKALELAESPDYFAMSDAMVEGTFENVRHHIRVFSMME